MNSEFIDIGRLREVLLTGEYLGEDDIARADTHAAQKQISFIDALLVLHLLTKDLLGQCIAESVGLKYLPSDSMPVDRETIQNISEDFARTNRVIYISGDSQSVMLVSDRPLSTELPRALAMQFPDRTVDVRYALSESIDAALKLYEAPLAAQFATLFASTTATSIPDLVTKVVNHAVDLKVSDIHFEPREADVVVRFRIDGILLDAARIPKAFYGNVLNRMKILARLPLDEHMRTQDGSFRHVHTGGVVNIRISVAPTIDGEKVALRLLTAHMSTYTVETLGLSVADHGIFTEAAKKPFGMILVTGPTGSGKTTTLYAFLNILNTPEVNITTIEDPVEYKVEGINQMQTNVATDLTFARGLRSIVRQDPDIVLVGEIRDKETAEIAVNAALTGHLLFSTFHSNDAATTVPRLLDMGIEPFLLASTLELIVAQRLLRKICESCKATYSITQEEIQRTLPRLIPYLSESQYTFYRGKGCRACHMTGYRGRTGIYEMIKNSPELQELIVKHPTRADIWAIAKKQGSQTLFDDGLEKAKEGITTLEELMRVAEPLTERV
jgi:type IV pilus assembly protein PilB